MKGGCKTDSSAESDNYDCATYKVGSQFVTSPAHTYDILTSYCWLATCGNNVLDDISQNEECDDSVDTKHIGGDGCSKMCKIEHGWKCPKKSNPCYKIPCGNGKIDRGEQCDDANDEDDDYCDNNC